MTVTPSLRTLSLAALLLAGLLGATPASTASPDGAPAPFVVTDKTGDVAPFFNPGIPAQTPTNAATNQVDLETLSIVDEDELGLTVQVKVVSLNGLAAPLADVGPDGFYFEVDFKLGGTDITYALVFYPAVGGPAQTMRGTEPVESRFNVYLPGSEPNRFGGNSYRQRVASTVNWDEGVLAARVSKDAIMGREPYSLDRGVPVGIPVLTKGHQLMEFAVYAQSPFPTFLSDRLPDRSTAAERYALQAESANTKVRLGLTQQAAATGGGDEFGFGVGDPQSSFTAIQGAVSVTPGTPTLVPIRVENLNLGKRFVNLTTRPEDPKDAAKWSFQIVPTVTVPGGDVRIVNLIVNATASIQHRESTNVTLLAKSLGFANEVGALKLNLVGSVPPGPDRKNLFFHGRLREGGNALSDTLCSNPLFFCGREQRWMNTLESDPLSGFSDGIPFEDQTFLNSDLSAEYGQTFTTDTPLGRDLVLNVDEPIETTLAIEPRLAFPATVTVELLAGQKFVGTASTTADVQPGGTVTVSFLPLIDAERISVADGGLTIRITLQVPTAGPGATGMAGELRLLAEKSRLSLPLIADPDAVLVNALPLGPAFVTLIPLGEPEEFVNPGRTKIYNATVTNEGVQDDEVTLTVLADQPDWTITIAPGNKFQLKPGESAKVGFLIKAPSTAQESDQLQILINATSRLGGSQPLSQLRLVAVVTTNVDIPDETGGFIVEAETASKLAAGSAKKSPTLGGPLLALGLLLAAVGLGRRRLRA